LIFCTLRLKLALKHLIILLVFFTLSACQDLPKEQTKTSADSNLAAEKPSAPSDDIPLKDFKPLDSLWHWESAQSRANWLFYNSDTGNQYRLIPISKADFESHRRYYLAYELYHEKNIAGKFSVPSTKRVIKYDTAVQNPNWVSHDWRYYYNGYAPKLKLHFVARVNKVAQNLIIDSISGVQIVTDGNYDGAWTYFVPAPGKDRFLLLGHDTYSSTGYSLITVKLNRDNDSLILKKEGQFSSENYFPDQAIWLNRKVWALRCLSFRLGMDPDKAEPDTLYFKSEVI